MAERLSSAKKSLAITGAAITLTIAALTADILIKESPSKKQNVPTRVTPPRQQVPKVKVGPELAHEKVLARKVAGPLLKAFRHDLTDRRGPNGSLGLITASSGVPGQPTFSTSFDKARIAKDNRDATEVTEITVTAHDGYNIGGPAGVTEIQASRIAFDGRQRKTSDNPTGNTVLATVDYFQTPIDGQNIWQAAGSVGDRPFSTERAFLTSTNTLANPTAAQEFQATNAAAIAGQAASKIIEGLVAVTPHQ